MANTMFPKLYEARSLVRPAFTSIGRVLTTKITVDTDPASSPRLALTSRPFPLACWFLIHYIESKLTKSTMYSKSFASI